MQGVRILNTSVVKVPSSGEKLPLSFLDARWIHLQQPVQNILLYPNSTLSSSSLDFFKSSLARTVSLFHPLAGKLTYQLSTDQLIIDCSSVDNGILVIEAESDLNIHQLVSEDIYDIESYMKLVPYISMEKLPLSVFAVQITRFVGGGVTVGTALNHCAMDGIGFWRFMETWAEICLNDSTGFAFGLETNHDRSVILHPKKEEIARQFLQQLAPDLPQLQQVTKASAQDRPILHRTFTLNLADIQALKSQVILQSKPPISTPSSFVAIAAHFWVCLVKSKVRSNKNETTSLWLLVDLRSHFSSISSENDALFTGNCIRGIQAKSTCKDLTGPNGLASACVAITQAVQTVREEPMKGVDNWPEEFKNRPIGMSVMVAGSTRYGAYNVDFGWGKPGRVELVSMNYDGEVSMLAGQDKGSVQATVGLAHEHIEMFSNAFMTGLGRVHNDICARTAKL